MQHTETISVQPAFDCDSLTLLKHAGGEAYTLIEERSNGRVRTWYARRGGDRTINQWITVDRNSINAPNGERHVERLFLITTKDGTTTIHRPRYERPEKKSFMDEKYAHAGVRGVKSWCRERIRELREPKVTRVRYRVTRDVLDAFDRVWLLVVEVDVDEDGGWSGKGEMQRLVPSNE
ncbi:hypothetical protein ACFQJ5_14720 [Halomicroarcula sp. GCM10025324]|uniref:hypothetical protein n=1 Tax=Haloarcula TaxID=2237 RepID=UPI0023E8BCD9|nr:hypothetical protein [Halomicroarcula sp. ZS-22-S1]